MSTLSGDLVESIRVFQRDVPSHASGDRDCDDILLLRALVSRELNAHAIGSRGQVRRLRVEGGRDLRATRHAAVVVLDERHSPGIEEREERVEAHRAAADAVARLDGHARGWPRHREAEEVLVADGVDRADEAGVRAERVRQGLGVVGLGLGNEVAGELAGSGATRDRGRPRVALLAGLDEAVATAWGATCTV